MDVFEKAVDHLMLYEVGMWWSPDLPGAMDGLIDTKEHRRNCGFVQDPNDSGGTTKYGIAQVYNPEIDVRTLNWPTAKQIYLDKYWYGNKCHRMGDRVAVLFFDMCVNPGPLRATKILQTAVGVDDDGKIGPTTLGVLGMSDQNSVCETMCDLRAAHYRRRATADPKNQRYLDGWLNRTEGMRTFIRTF
jgi:lysozyme family protein